MFIDGKNVIDKNEIANKFSNYFVNIVDSMTTNYNYSAMKVISVSVHRYLTTNIISKLSFLLTAKVVNNYSTVDDRLYRLAFDSNTERNSLFLEPVNVVEI